MSSNEVTIEKCLKIVIEIVLHCILVLYYKILVLEFNCKITILVAIRYFSTLTWGKNVTCVGNYAHGHVLAKAIKQQIAFRLVG